MTHRHSPPLLAILAFLVTGCGSPSDTPKSTGSTDEGRAAQGPVPGTAQSLEGGKGSTAKLKTLAQTRGAVILAFFEEAGIDRDRFIVIAHGNDKPLTDKKDRRSRAKNNRVELRLHNVASGK